jgi:hypothetical protein
VSRRIPRLTRRRVRFFNHRLDLWLIADVCETYTIRPSEFLELNRKWAIPPDLCADFDIAVRAIKRWADDRESQVRYVPDTRSNSKPTVPVPRFRGLVEILALNPDGSTPVAEDRFVRLRRQADNAADLVRAGGEIDWSRFEYE